MCPCLSVQIIYVHYQGKTLSLLDSDDITALYMVKIPEKGLKMSLFYASKSSSSPPAYDLKKSNETSKSLAATAFSPPPAYCSEDSDGDSIPVATATFSHFSTLITFSIHSHQVSLQRESGMNRNYIFTSPEGEALRWENDGFLSGDWKLLGANGDVRARFRNKVFSSSELGSFEIVGVEREKERDLIVMSGLATLAMVQSTLLAALIVTGGAD